jgi:hypothetical protein
MYALSGMRIMWKMFCYELTIWGKILYFPGMVVCFLMLLIVGIVEVFIFDIWCIPMMAKEYNMSFKQVMRLFWYV